MTNFFYSIYQNKILWICFAAYLSAQILKVIFVLCEEKRLDFTRFVGAGGMPSSHSAFVTALATAVGMTQGFDSALFAVCVCFAAVVMYDASGVRRAAGEQAKVINKIIFNFNSDDNPDNNISAHLKELLGHTPFQVAAGSVLGVAVALILI